MYVVHKGDCDRTLTREKGGDIDGGWHELRYAFELMTWSVE